MAADPLPPAPSQAPPDALVTRTAVVATEVLNTIRVPTDRFQDGKQNWYKTDGEMPGVIEGNRVKFLIDGKDAFADMVAAIRTATQPGHFIYIGSWWCDVQFEIQPGVTLAQLVTDASAKGVMIRAMLWQTPGSSQNRDAILFFNSLEEQVGPQGPVVTRKKVGLDNAAAIWDRRGDERVEDTPFWGALPFVHLVPRFFGAQHQKILSVYGEQGLVGFCGGIEFNSDRINPPPPRKTGWFASANQTGDGGPLHDVHCRIEGPASFEIAKIFIQRWNDHPDRKKIENSKHGKPPLIIPPVPVTTPGEHIVQVGRTFGRSNYSFAPPRPSAPQGGETTAAQLIANAIRKAKRFIYTEDQYFVGTPLLENALMEALPNIEHFTAVITFWTMTGMPFVNEHRRKFINKLRTVGGDKVRIFSIQHFPKSEKAKSRDFYDGFEPHTYIHTKSWIIDDEFATIGSINSNRRGWSHDCEVSAGIYERSTDQFLHYRFAHWLRIKLWHEHLGLQEAELVDGRASAVHWLQRPDTAVVRPYNLNETNSVGENDLKVPVPFPFIPTILDHNQHIWDHFVDPE